MIYLLDASYCLIVAVEMGTSSCTCACACAAVDHLLLEQQQGFDIGRSLQDAIAHLLGAEGAGRDAEHDPK